MPWSIVCNLLATQGRGGLPHKGAASLGNLTICKRRSSRYQARQSLGDSPAMPYLVPVGTEANFD